MRTLTVTGFPDGFLFFKTYLVQNSGDNLWRYRLEAMMARPWVRDHPAAKFKEHHFWIRA
jgi:hypothetical protein